MAEDPGESLSAELVSDLVKITKALFEHEPPKIRGTYDYLKRLFEKMGVEDEGLMASISDLRSKTLKAAHEQRPDRIYPELSSWVGRK